MLRDRSIKLPADQFASRWLLALSIMLVISHNAYALDVNGNGDRNGLVSLYLFDEGAGNVVHDKITTGGALDLIIDQPSRAQWGQGSLTLLQENLLRSQGPATKIINQCKGSDELTIEVWLQNQKDDMLERLGPLRIVTLSKRSDNGAFYLGQNYDGNTFYQANIKRDSRADLNDEDDSLRTDEGIFKKSPSLQQVIFTRDRSGVARIYVSDGNGIPVLRATSTRFNGNFGAWTSDLILGVGNEPSYREPRSPANVIDPENPLFKPDLTTETRGWRGTLHLLGIYCKALTIEEILAERAPTNWLAPREIPLDPNGLITPNRKKAQLIYRRLVGVTTPIDDPVLKAMEQDLAQGSEASLLAAARKATEQAGFYNRTVKDFAKRMSNRDETVNTPLTDFSAMVIGHTHDNGDARELLTGDFYYKGDPARTAVPSNLLQDLLTSNRHFASLEEQNYDLSSVLVRVNGQSLYNGSTGVQHNTDAGGLLTTRAFMAAHAIGGTNRRLVEFSFREFLCRPITQWADNKAPDEFVGRDVDRFPTGDHTKYQTSCRGCHSQMDPLRSAFSRLTFENGYLKHAWIVPPDASGDANNNPENMSTMQQVPRGIASKMNRNSEVFPAGAVTTDNYWYNRATSGLNAEYFGWEEGTLEGKGIKQFGHMISRSKAFPRCMAERAFRSVCKREAQEFDRKMLLQVAEKFSTEDGYKMRRLFERIAVTPECLGQE